MNEKELKEEFEKHMRSRECERPSMAMLYDLFLEGFKFGSKAHPSFQPKKKKETISE